MIVGAWYGTLLPHERGGENITVGRDLGILTGLSWATKEQAEEWGIHRIERVGAKLEGLAHLREQIGPVHLCTVTYTVAVKHLTGRQFFSLSYAEEVMCTSSPSR